MYRSKETASSSTADDQTISNLCYSVLPVLPSCLYPRFGSMAACGRRRDMEDAVAIHPSFFSFGQSNETSGALHFFGLYDGHGCSHVSKSCKYRMHQLVKGELNGQAEATLEWKKVLERSFAHMDKEVLPCGNIGNAQRTICGCNLQMLKCDEVGSTAVVSIVTPDKIVVGNCGDSRAILCRGGEAVPLSIDHKPDRPDELERIQNAGGYVVYMDGIARVFGSLSMSRAIGDNYLKPYVSSVPEVTITERTIEDECLILASDGLWDVMSNDMACRIVRTCLNIEGPAIPRTKSSDNQDKVCSDAAILLTKVALARRSMDNVSVVVSGEARTLFLWGHTLK